MSVDKPVLIAEIGCNHQGDIDLAKKFVSVAADFCDVRWIKFQKRTIAEVLSPEEHAAPHPNPHNSYGETYGEHREVLEFDLDQHAELRRHCADRGVKYGCSVWDPTSLREILTLEPDFVKVPSAANTNTEMLGIICEDYRGQIHLSVGMTTREEESAIVEFLRGRGRLGDLVLYSCTSGYPVPPKDVCLLEVSRLRESYGKDVGGLGFSGHHNGIALDVAAYTLGAVYVERHFTLDRTWKGTDHAASLEPDGLRRVERNLMQTWEAMQFKDEEVLEIEKPQRAKLKWNRGSIS